MKAAIYKTITRAFIIVVTMFAIFSNVPSSFATTKGLSQIVTPELEPEGDFSLSFQLQDKRIANPYQLQAELGLTEWAEVAVFLGFQPDEWIFGTEIGLLRKEPYLLSIGFINWRPTSMKTLNPLSKLVIGETITKCALGQFMPATK